MYNTIDALNVRIQLLQNRDPIGNMRIINKLKRRVRLMESKWTWYGTGQNSVPIFILDKPGIYDIITIQN